jgi:glycosyltransferase involved in cell wall biosynthesis
MPIVSVIIPVFNGAATIAQTLRSVLRQSFRDFEVLIINDGSTDDTVNVVESFDDPRLRLCSFENRGLSASRNRGIDLAAGEYLSFLDADDLWSADKLEAQLDVLRKRDAGAAYSWTCSIDAGDRILYGHAPVRYEGDVYAALLRGNFISSGSNLLMRRVVVDRVGRFDESLSCGEDWDYSIRAAALCRFALAPRYQIYYRQLPTSMSRNLERQHQNTLRVIDRSYAAAPPHVQKDKPVSLALAHLYLARTYLAWRPNAGGVEAARACLSSAWRHAPATLVDWAAIRLLLRWSAARYLSPAAADRLVALYRRYMVSVRQIPPPFGEPG